MWTRLQLCFAGFRRLVTGAAWRLPLVLSALAMGLHLLSPPAVAPRQWEELAVAFGLRPPTGALSGLWILLLSGLEAVLPPEVLVAALRLSGALAAGVLVWLCDRLFDWLLPSLLRARLLTVSDGLFWKRLLTGVPAFALVCGDAVWSACQSPGSALGQIAGVLATVVLWIGLLRLGRHYWLPLATFSLGLLTGDGFFATVLFLVLLAYLFVRASGKVGRIANELTNPIVLRAVTARAVCGYLVGAAAALLVNVGVYRGFGGVSRATTEVGDVLRALVGDPLVAVADACSPGGCVFLLLIVIVPLTIIRFAISRLWPKTGESSVLFLLPVGGAAVVTFTQVTGFGCSEAWLPAARRAGDFARAVWTFGGLMVIVWGLACVVARIRAVEDFRWRRGVLAAVVLALLVMFASVPLTRIRPVEWELQDLVGTYCPAVADECAGDSRVLTDGSLDAGVELAAWHRGRRLLAVSTTSGDSPHEVKLRQRGVTDAEDLKALESGAADALREWLEIRTNGLSGVAAQTGFDRRRTFGDAVRPRFSGLVAHFGGEEGSAERAEQRFARQIGRRIVEICRLRRLTGRIDPALLEAFRRVQWRVSVACRQRLDDSKMPVADLAADSVLADELDRLNPDLEALRRRYGWQAEHHGALILPREGLKLALAKRDFNLAGLYAEQVLKTAPDDAEANFAMGMRHYLNRQFARAVPHLKRVLEVGGENPGVLNNLAMAYLRLEAWTEAEALAERACRAAPGDAAILESSARIRSQARAGGRAVEK